LSCCEIPTRVRTVFNTEEYLQPGTRGGAEPPAACGWEGELLQSATRCGCWRCCVVELVAAEVWLLDGENERTHWHAGRWIVGLAPGNGTATSEDLSANYFDAAKLLLARWPACLHEHNCTSSSHRHSQASQWPAQGLIELRGPSSHSSAASLSETHPPTPDTARVSRMRS
jgi:hypothetical protein